MSEQPTYFRVSFSFADDRPDANTQDFRDELMEYFEQAVLEGRMTDVIVRLDHARQIDSQCACQMRRGSSAYGGWIINSENCKIHAPALSALLRP